MSRLVSVDTGNGMIKTVNTAFTSGYMEGAHAIDGDVLSYKGKEYALSNTRVVQKNDKTENEDYFILTLFAIGKELMSDFKSGKLPTGMLIDITLLCGLPPVHFKVYREKFRQYFMDRGGNIHFTLNNQPMNVRIVDTFVSPQAYAAALTVVNEIAYAPLVNIIDIGGYTSDYVQLERLRINMDICTSSYTGVNTMFQKISEQVRATGGATGIRDKTITDIILNDSKSIVGYSKARVDLIQSQARKLANDILSEATSYGMDLTEDTTVFIGGGSLLLKEYFVNTGKVKKMIFVDDIHANAKGYELIHKARKPAA